MRDRRLRQLERQAQHEGTPAARAELLRARLRAGTLSPVWLEVAARLGDEAARAALGRPLEHQGPTQTLDLLDLGVDAPGQLAEHVAARRLARLEARELPAPVAPARKAAHDWLEAGGDAQRATCAALLPELERAISDLRLTLLRTRKQLRANAPVVDPDGEPDAAYLATVAREREALAAQVAALERDERALEAARLPLGCAAAVAPRAALAWLEQHADLEREAGGSLALRRLLIPWALSPARAGDPPPPGWTTPPDRIEAQLRELAAAAQRDDPQAAFTAQLDDKAVKRQATGLRRRLRQKTLSKDRVGLAAKLGDPAAWLVAKLPGEPLLEPHAGDPQTVGAEYNARLIELLASFAKDLPKDEVRRLRVLRRLRDPEGDLRDPGPAWPPWSGTLIARLALALGETALARAQTRDPVPAQALEAARAFQLRPTENADAVEALAKQAAKVAGRRRRQPDPQRCALRALAWSVELIVRAHRRARQPRLDYANRPLLRECLLAGLSPAELWDLLRETAIAWALEADDLGVAARRYSPRESFVPGEALEHPTFGPGKVVAVRGRNMDVAFESGETKTLAHAG